jgi:hypothetical protein
MFLFAEGKGAVSQEVLVFLSLSPFPFVIKYHNLTTLFVQVNHAHDTGPLILCVCPRFVLAVLVCTAPSILSCGLDYISRVVRGLGSWGAVAD